MIYNTRKNASTKSNTLNHTVKPELQLVEDEFLNIEPDETIRMKCDRCGYEENVPTWVLDEFAEIDSELTCMCAGCSIGTMHEK